MRRVVGITVFSVVLLAGRTSAQLVLCNETPITSGAASGGRADTMRDPSAIGFTPPPGPRTDTLSKQQLGAATNSEFDNTVSPVPEPGSLLLAGCAALAAFSRWLRRLAKPAKVG
jgi:hypothetical protein